MIVSARWVLVTIACLVLPGSACSESTAPGGDAGPEVVLVLSAPDGTARNTFEVGAPIHLRLTLRNPTTTELRLAFSSGRTHDAVVSAADGSERWRWSARRAFTQALAELSLAAGAELEFELVCDPARDDGEPLPPGRYRAAAIIPAFDVSLRSAPVVFDIE